MRPAASPIIVVGNRFILLIPESVRRWAIREFGTNDKSTLLTGIYVVIGLFAVVVGLATVRRYWWGLIGIGLFGAIGVYCALTTHAHRATDVIPTIGSTLAGMAALLWLVRAAFGEQAFASPTPSALSPSVSTAGLTNRRRFVQGSVMTAVLAAIAGFGGRSLQRTRFDVTAARAAVALPAPASPAPALAVGTDLGKSGVPFVTPNRQFYRVDTALTLPQLDPSTWKLRIHGLVDHEITLTYEDLLARPLIERWITMACVSNEVGGDLVGTARFLGARFADVLREAGIQSHADQLVLRSPDGMTIGTPTAVVMDGRDAMLAVGMNGVALPIEHGFPVRVVVPGLYGYVSGCKWVVDVEATTFSAYDAYWVQQGWVAQAPVQLSSRIDRPSDGQSFHVGDSVVFAGVAWEQHVGVAKVEIQVDDGPWTEARLADVPSLDTWRQWVLPWTATKGAHLVRVRAVDRTGAVQIAKVAEPYPGAASGYHTIHISAQ